MNPPPGEPTWRTVLPAGTPVSPLAELTGGLTAGLSQKLRAVRAIDAQDAGTGVVALLHAAVDHAGVPVSVATRLSWRPDGAVDCACWIEPVALPPAGARAVLALTVRLTGARCVLAGVRRWGELAVLDRPGHRSARPTRTEALPGRLVALFGLGPRPVTAAGGLLVVPTAWLPAGAGRRTAPPSTVDSYLSAVDCVRDAELVRALWAGAAARIRLSWSAGAVPVAGSHGSAPVLAEGGLDLLDVPGVGLWRIVAAPTDLLDPTDLPDPTDPASPSDPARLSGSPRPVGSARPDGASRVAVPGAVALVPTRTADVWRDLVLLFG